MTLNTLMVRYIVESVDAAVDFYAKHFGFRLANQSGQNFALLERANLQLVLSPRWSCSSLQPNLSNSVATRRARDAENALP